MNPRHTLQLRYRPGSDVLSGEVALDLFTAGDAAFQQPDQHTSFLWAPLLDGGEALAGFQLVGARSVLARRSASGLPAAVVTQARRLIDAAQHQQQHTDTYEALTHLDTQRVQLTIPQLRRRFSGSVAATLPPRPTLNTRAAQCGRPKG